jgi:hypothetical protein
MTAPERFADSQIPLAPRAPPYMTHHVDSRPPISALRKVHSPLCWLPHTSDIRGTPMLSNFTRFSRNKDRLNCGQALSAIDVWSTTMMIGKMA